MSTTWQLIGQAVPGPLASVEPLIPYGYSPHGLIAQSAPDRFVGRGIVNRMLINIQGEVYRVQDMGSSSVGSTNENPYGKSFMKVSRMRGG
ncbi:MAG: hypothetical protein P8X74_06710 [Reinekea sp.]